jgi:uncharacterized protein (TIGR02145 family)
MIKKIILFFTILIINVKLLKAQLVDIDGNVYKTERIGVQNLRYCTSTDGNGIVEVLIDSLLIWTTSNLNVSKFKNGDLIKEVKSDAEWEDALNNGIPAWCYLDNDSSNGKTHGKLYNYYAVTNLKGLAPEGWHIASDFEWEMVYKYYNVRITEENLYEDSKIFMSPEWKSPYPWGYGNNKTGFNALPGYRMTLGFSKDGAYYWSDIKIDRSYGSFHYILGDNEICAYGCGYNFGFSVRCVKDW